MFELIDLSWKAVSVETKSSLLTVVYSMAENVELSHGPVWSYPRMSSVMHSMFQLMNIRLVRFECFHSEFLT